MVDFKSTRGRHAGEPADALPDFGQRVAAVRCEVLRDAERREKFRIVCEDIRRRVAAVKVAQETGHGFYDQRVRITFEIAFAVAKNRDEPKLGQTAGNQILVHSGFWPERPAGPGFFDE